MVIEAHDALYDLNRIFDQQDKVNLISTDTSIFLLITRSKVLQIPNEDLIYLAKQLFGRRNADTFTNTAPMLLAAPRAIAGKL